MVSFRNVAFKEICIIILCGIDFILNNRVDCLLITQIKWMYLSLYTFIYIIYIPAKKKYTVIIALDGDFLEYYIFPTVEK